MIYNIAFRGNWDQIEKRKQDIINESSKIESKEKNCIRKSEEP
jgi:hypothetical protein